MKILHIMKEFSAPTQTFIYDLLVNLEATQGFSNHVLYYRKRSNEQSRAFPNVTGFEQLAARYGSGFEKLMRHIRSDYRNEALFGRYVMTEAFNILHCHFAWSAIDCVYEDYENLLQKIPLVISTHGSDITKYTLDPDYHSKLKQLCAHPNVWITGSTDFMRQELINQGIEVKRFRVLPNVLNPLFLDIRSKAKVVDSQTEGYRIACNARLIGWKGHEYLIRAFAQFKQELCGDSQLVLIGDGKLKNTLISLCEELQITSNVTFLGTVSHNKVADILLGCHLYVQPSIVDPKTKQSETFGVAILEALAAGLPVITTKTGGIPYWLGEENGSFFYAKEANSDDLFSKIKQCYLRHKDLRVSESFVDSLLETYSLESQKIECLRVYEAALSAVVSESAG